MEDLTSLRKKINGLDDEIVQLLNERFRIVKLIGKYKKENNVPIYDQAREEKVISRLTEKQVDSDMVQTIWPAIMDFAKTLE